LYNIILVIGYGSIGRRHVRILKRINKNNKVYILTKQKIKNRINDLSEVLKLNPDYIIIASKTSLHFKHFSFIEKNFKNKIVLIEKPLFDLYRNIKPKNNYYYVGYNLRFNPVLQNIKKLIFNKKIWNVNIFCGSYLPTWRPNRDYRNTYSSIKEEGGGVLLDLSHEIDYANWLFGPLNILYSNISKNSNLNIDVEDNATIIAKNDMGTIINISLNYFSRKPIRQIIIDGQNISIKSDLLKNKLMYIKNKKIHKNSYKKTNINYSYLMQHKSIISSKKNLSSFNNGLVILKLINKIKKNC
jgi:CMP-N,N'-diacetyllegionaminic acid synthase|tara:strand:- start:1799 stop:2698 length:900 start_codon:yes stop_codon:yes gene_type:complete